MGIRESLLNTITSVGNGDFIRIVTSAGASSKATLANVFKSFESGLGAKSSLTTADYIRVVGSDNVSYKQPVEDVLYANGVRYKVFPVGTAFSDFADSCVNGITFSYNRYPTQSSDAPPASVSDRCAIIVYKTASDEIVISALIFTNTNEPTTYVRRRFGSWGNWVKLPTRAEIDALNSKSIRVVSWSYSLVAYGSANTSLKSLIDADLPAGYTFRAVSGFATNNPSAVFTSVRYGGGDYGIQIRNIASSDVSATATVYYACSKA